MPYPTAEQRNPLLHPNVRVESMAEGWAGLAATLRVMREAVRHALPKPLTRAAAAEIVRGVPASNTGMQASLLRRWLQNHVAFVRDPVEVEYIQTPWFMLEHIALRGFVDGDCDDVAVLGAALGMSIGIRARFVLFAFGRGQPFSHVFTELLTDAGWVELDTTRPQGDAATLTPSRTKYVTI